MHASVQSRSGLNVFCDTPAAEDSARAPTPSPEVEPGPLIACLRAHGPTRHHSYREGVAPARQHNELTVASRVENVATLTWPWPWPCGPRSRGGARAPLSDSSSSSFSGRWHQPPRSKPEGHAGRASCPDAAGCLVHERHGPRRTPQPPRSFQVWPLRPMKAARPTQPTPPPDPPPWHSCGRSEWASQSQMPGGQRPLRLWGAGAGAPPAQQREACWKRRHRRAPCRAARSGLRPSRKTRRPWP